MRLKAKPLHDFRWRKAMKTWAVEGGAITYRKLLSLASCPRVIGFRCFVSSRESFYCLRFLLRTDGRTGRVYIDVVVCV